MLQAAIRTYVSSHAYQHSVIARQPRVDLDGNVVQAIITDEETAHAKRLLEVLAKKINERRKTQSLEPAKTPTDLPSHQTRKVETPKVETRPQGERSAAPAHPVPVRQKKNSPHNRQRKGGGSLPLPAPPPPLPPPPPEEMLNLPPRAPSAPKERRIR